MASGEGERVAHAAIYDSTRIVVQTSWNENEILKQVPGTRFHAGDKVWTVPLTWAACVQLRGVFRDTLTIGPDLNRWAATERDRRVDPALKLRGLTKPSEDHATLISGMMPEQLYDFQRAGVHWLYVAECALLGDDLGSGKTIQILELLRMIDDYPDVLPALVICPNGVKPTWGHEASIWLKRAHPYVVAGSAAVRQKIMNAAAKDPLALVIINIEATRTNSRLAGYGSQRLKRCLNCGGKDLKVKHSQCEVHAKHLNMIPFKTVIMDEAHRIKDPNSKQTRAAWALGQGEHVKRRYATTGTPIANDPSDLWSIMHFVEPSEYPVKTPFVDRYCLLSWGTYGGMEVKGLRPDTRDEFYRFFDSRYRRMIKDVIAPQLPPRIRTTRFVELAPKQLKAYRDIEDKLITRLPDGNIMVAPNDLEARLRLLQFSSATMEQVGVDPKTGKPQFRMCDPSPKVDELIEIFEELEGRPFVVSAEHRQLIELAASRLTKLKIPHGLITGRQHEFERKIALQDFQAGKLPVLLFTLKAGGTGLTMTRADTMVCLQRADSMIDNIQVEGRVHRIGSEKHEVIQYIDVIARGTVEEKQIERLQDKMRRLEEINRDRAQLIAAGLSTEALDFEEKAIVDGSLL